MSLRGRCARPLSLKKARGGAALSFVIRVSPSPYYAEHPYRNFILSKKLTRRNERVSLSRFMRPDNKNESGMNRANSQNSRTGTRHIYFKENNPHAISRVPPPAQQRNILTMRICLLLRKYTK